MKFAKSNNTKNQKKAKRLKKQKVNRKFRAKASKASMAQSLIWIKRIEVDEDDNSVMNISFPVSKADNVTKAWQ
jgi:ATP-binding cassette subfamily F protein 3